MRSELDGWQQRGDIWLISDGVSYLLTWIWTVDLWPLLTALHTEDWGWWIRSVRIRITHTIFPVCHVRVWLGTSDRRRLEELRYGFGSEQHRGEKAVYKTYKRIASSKRLHYSLSESCKITRFSQIKYTFVKWKGSLNDNMGIKTILTMGCGAGVGSLPKITVSLSGGIWDDEVYILLLL